jgi:hypothetical protein
MTCTECTIIVVNKVGSRFCDYTGTTTRHSNNINNIHDWQRKYCRKLAHNHTRVKGAGFGTCLRPLSHPSKRSVMYALKRCAKCARASAPSPLLRATRSVGISSILVTCVSRHGLSIGMRLIKRYRAHIDGEVYSTISTSQPGVNVEVTT